MENINQIPNDAIFLKELAEEGMYCGKCGKQLFRRVYLRVATEEYIDEIWCKQCKVGIATAPMKLKKRRKMKKSQ